MGWRAWTRERLTASLLQDYIQDQVVQHYLSRAQRLSEGPAVPTEGMVSWLEDEQMLEVYTAGGWITPPALGLIASSSQSTNGTATDVGTTQTRASGTVNGSVKLYPGRIYEVKMECGLAAGTTGTQHEATVKMVSGVSVPVNTDPTVSGVRAALNGVGTPWGWYGETVPIPFTVTAANEFGYSPFFRRTGGTGTTQLLVNAGTNQMRIRVYDMGSAAMRSVRNLSNEEALLSLAG